MIDPRERARLVSISRSGRYVALASVDGVDVVDALGTAPRHAVVRPVNGDFACVGNALWIVDGAQIRRWSLDGGKAIEPAVVVPFSGGCLRPLPGDPLGTTVVVADRAALVFAIHDRVGCEPLEDFPAGTWPVTARRLLRADRDGMRIVDVGRGEAGRLKPVEGTALGAWPLFAGRAIAILLRGAEDAFLVCRADGALIHRLELPRVRHVAIAQQRGTAIVIGEDGTLLAIDLRYGRTLNQCDAPVGVADLDIDADGLYVAIATASERGAPHVVHLAMTELLAGSSRPQPARKPEPEDAEEPEPRAAGRDVASDARPALIDAASGQPPAPEDEATDLEPVAPVEIPDVPPLAFGRPSPPLTATAVPGAAPYATALEHFDELLDLVAALAGRAIALGWHSGRLSATADDARPFQREVHALLGGSGQLAADEVAETERAVTTLSARLSTRARSSLAAGLRLPVIDLARELGLTAIATQVLAVAIGPAVRGEIARLYGILSNDESRPLCDVLLITHIVAGGDPALRAQVQRELADDAPLVRFGLLRVHTERSRLFAAVTVDDVLIERLRGDAPSAGLGDVTSLRHGDRTVGQLRVPPGTLRDLILACAEPRDAASPLRLVVRGRRGSGRTTVIATLAARLDRPISVIDCERMPRNGRRIAAALRGELFRALLRGTVPVVSNLELMDAEDVEGRDAIRQVVRGHPGPVIVRASPEATIPFEPGHQSFTLPPLSESERGAVWRELLATVRLPCGDVDGLAARYRVGPGTITAVVHSVAQRRAQSGVQDDDVDAGPQLDEAARQHIATRLDRVASHVTRLAEWEQVALPDDVLDSLREFIGRVRHRRTVYETWGFDKKMSTSRGLTALFYGPPGTGKSMVAGLIARELGLDLYRVDLARVVSKWIGETEKNLAEVFDAAEDGQVVVLFDEADSMFAKRTDVKTSVDRYANLEVNYLLQRLDSFEGIAILTTNLEGAIDPAFKRRMSIRLQFPFPDEEIRARLWAAHVPPEVPVHGDLDFAELAHRFPLSGGYIRNSALRAAFLAAQEDRPLSYEHLVRAIQLEYRELGKLSASGRME